jgi:hypothetical protein
MAPKALQAARQNALAKAASLGCGPFTDFFLRFGRHSQLFL